MCPIWNLFDSHTASHWRVGQLLNLSNEGVGFIKNDDLHICPNLENAM